MLPYAMLIHVALHFCLQVVDDELKRIPRHKCQNQTWAIIYVPQVYPSKIFCR